jgi:hypothetical protein
MESTHVVFVFHIVTARKVLMHVGVVTQETLLLNEQEVCTFVQVVEKRKDNKY